MNILPVFCTKMCHRHIVPFIDITKLVVYVCEFLATIQPSIPDKFICLQIALPVTDSAADKAELLEGDEVLEINDEVVSDRNRGYCMLLINGSLQKNGKLDVYIKRDYSKGKN